MSKRELYELLEECLRLMQAGTTLEEALRAHPQQAAELRPLLEAALEARSLQAGPAPAAAQNRSRAQFLSAAAARRPARQARRVFGLPFRSLGSLVPTLIVLLVLVSSLFVTGLVSAESLPGDGLYPVKIAVEQTCLRLTTGVASRLSLEETFDQRRVVEVADLLERGQVRSVSFAGFLSRPEIDMYRVAGIPVTFSASMDTPIVSLVGTYVEVNGKTGTGQVDVSQMQLRLFHVTGKIEAMNPQLWQVNGVPVKIAPETHILGTPALGRQVQISAIRVATDRLLALAVRFVDAPSAAQQNDMPTSPPATPAVTITSIPPTASVTATTAPTATPLPTQTKQIVPSAVQDGEQDSSAPSSDLHSGEDGGDHKGDHEGGD